MKKTRRSKIATIVFVCLIISFGILFVVSFIQKQEAQEALTTVSGGSEQDARNAVTVRVTPVGLGSIENTVMVNGDVLAESQVAVYPTVGGKLVELRAALGDTVERNQVIAMVDPSRPGDNYSRSPVLSTITGTVLDIPVDLGDTLSAATAVAMVGNVNNLVLETSVPERFASLVGAGLAAAVTFESMPGETFAAEIYELSPVVDPSSRTRRLRLRFLPGPSGKRDSRIIPGMFATISLVTRSKSNIPVIPRVSAINTYGSWIVFTVDETNTAKRCVVELGLESETLFEIVSGVAVGDRIVSAGQNFLADGDTVRIVD